MSKESFREFMTKLQKDVALQQELRKRGDPERGIPTDELAAFAAGKGYKFKVEELKGELDDDQLGAVSGGAAVDYFLKLDGLPGELATGKHYLKFESLFKKY